MGDILDMILRMNKRAAVDVFNMESEIRECKKSFKIFRDEIRKELLQTKNNFNKPIFQNASYKTTRSSKRLAETSSSDEEVDVSSTRVKLHNAEVSENIENTAAKPKRGAAKAASENIKKVSNMKLNSKMRRPSHEDNHQSSAIEFNPNIVKLEKRSESMLLEESAKSTVLTDVTNENMPPPTLKPKRGRKKVKKEIEDPDTSEKNSTERVTRSTRSKIKSEPRESKTTRTRKNTSKSPRRQDSDVLIQETPVTVIVVTDSESETDKSSSNVSSVQLNNIQELSETEIVTSKKTKPTKKGKKQTENKMKLKIKEEKQQPPVQEELKNNTQNSLQEVSVYEDALSENNQTKNNPETLKVPNSVNSVLNETRVINKSASENTSLFENSPAIMNIVNQTGAQLNCTVVLDRMHATFTVEQKQQQEEVDTKVLAEKPTIPSGLLTDDDDSIDVSPPAKTPIKKPPAKTKQIFSPYGNSPVKKRVAAFEKLGTAEAPARVTRTKTRNLAAAEKNQASPLQETPLHLNRPVNPPPPSSKTKKVFTPSTNNKLPTLIPHYDNKNKNKNTSAILSSGSVNSLTAVKASRAELQERREEEQKRKMEHENEVKRKKDALLHAKIEEQKRKREEKQIKAQKAREAKEREKEEKIRRIIQEKEEKLQKEEQMKREWMATMAKKAAEEEKYQQMLKKEKLEQIRKLNKKPPALPTDDLQDTDEEDENPKHKYIGPIWSQREHLYPTLYLQQFVPNTITREFFQMRAQTPDLLEIFETVNADILRRNSSAVWRTPPRFSTLPKF